MGSLSMKRRTESACGCQLLSGASCPDAPGYPYASCPEAMPGAVPRLRRGLSRGHAGVVPRDLAVGCPQTQPGLCGGPALGCSRSCCRGLEQSLLVLWEDESSPRRTVGAVWRGYGVEVEDGWSGWVRRGDWGRISSDFSLQSSALLTQNAF